MTECNIKSENIRLLGRLDATQTPICLDWTGSGFEVLFKGEDLTKWSDKQMNEYQQSYCYHCTHTEINSHKLAVFAAKAEPHGKNCEGQNANRHSGANVDHQSAENEENCRNI